jgi:hypothetical protein
VAKKKKTEGKDLSKSTVAEVSREETKKKKGTKKKSVKGKKLGKSALSKIMKGSATFENLKDIKPLRKNRSKKKAQ